MLLKELPSFDLIKTPLDAADERLFYDNISLTVVPEPSSYALFGLGLLSLWCLRKRECP
ncbi:MAG: PEP-CTERM sorting domain-containing protein [Verrucomicrobiota bacterium]